MSTGYKVPGTLVQKALAFARERHAGQRRKGDGKPFIVHPIAVGRILAREGMPDEVVAAGILHDVLEDTPTSSAEIARLFGRKVASWVEEVTEPDKRHSWEYRKRAYLRHLKAASRAVLAISCADKLHNTASLLAAYRKEGPVVFERFSRGVDRKLEYHQEVCRAIRRAWPQCPGLEKLERLVSRLEEISREQMKGEPKEVEAKFLPLDRKVFAEAGRLKSIGDFRLSRAHVEIQENRYWDTKDLRLRQAKAVLKTRRSGAKSEITFKREISHRRGVSERIEVTARLPVGTTYLDPSRYVVPVKNEPVLRARKISGSRPLVEILHLRTRRERRLFIRGSERVELDLDEMDVLKGGRVIARHREVEVENRSAREESFREVLAWLKRSYRGRLISSRLPKVEIGLRLLKKGRSR